MADLSVRAISTADTAAVLELVNADKLAGQPVADARMLGEALAGRSPFDAAWWDELDPPTTEVARDAADRIVGVVSYAIRPGDGAGVILWLYCREDETVAAALVDRALERLGRRKVHAFDFTSALTVGLDGVPARHRPATCRALATRGFVAEDRWRYMHALLPLPGLARIDGYETSDLDDGEPGVRLQVRGPDGTFVADATIGSPVDGIGTLEWIGVEPQARGRGLGSALLGSALDLLGELGAREVILWVDDDAPDDDPERSRAAANRMYDKAGLVEIDRLWSFCREA